jgi:hypothetical protein
VILELAENANAHVALGPGVERLVDPRFVIWLGRSPGPWFSVVQRLRLAEGGVEAALADVRALLAARGRTGSSWEVVEARRVRTLEEAVEAERIACEAFEMPAGVLEERLEGAAEALAAEGDRSSTFLAFVDGRPVARATSSYTPLGVLLFGGATRAEARGRGAYRALVRARWEDAVTRGTPVLVTQAGAMSQPILRRLGFREVARLAILRDDFGAAC